MGSKVLWAVIIGFLAGVGARSIVSLSWPAAGFVFILAVVALMLALLQKRSACIVVAVLLTCFGTGILRMDMATLQGDAALSPLIGKNVTVEGKVIAEPDVRENSVRVTVDTDTLIQKAATSTISARMLVVAPAHSTIEYGARIRASGRLDAPEPFDTGAGHVFNYPMYLAKDGVLYELSFAKVTSLAGGGTDARGIALSVKHFLLGGLYRAIPEPEAGLAAGITLGDKRSVGAELSQSFVRASLIHIVVLSGYNITVVINAASAALSYLPHIFRFGASGIVVAFFILMTGGAATSVRAGFMAFLAVYARLTGRTFLALRALGAAAVVMIAWNPWTLMYDPSFELSALATLGLVLFTPHFERWCTFVTTRFGLREIIASTLVTQTAVLPLLLYQSGNLSIVALPANIFALIAVSPAMMFSSLAALGGLILGQYAVIVGFPAYVLLHYIIGVAEAFASLPFASVQIPAFSGWILAATYALLLIGYFYMEKKTAGTNPAVSNQRESR